MNALLKLCKECARKGASKVGAIMFADDVAQDMAMFVLEKFLRVYDGERDVEPFLVEVGRRMGLAYYRRHSREVIIGDRPEGLDPAAMLEDSGMIADAQAEEDEQAAAATAARDILLERLRERRAAPEQKDRPKRRAESHRQPDPREPGKASSRRVVAADLQDERAARRQCRREALANRPQVRELVAIRNRLGLTQNEMAVALGFRSLWSVRSIEYGVVRGDVGGLLDLARDLDRKHSIGIDARAPGPELVRRWCLSLGLQEDDSAGLAARLGLHRVTVFRWRTGRTQPPPHVVPRVNAAVEALAAHE